MHTTPAIQSASAALLIRPACFGFNVETAETNRFQRRSASAAALIQQALDEWQGLADALVAAGIYLVVVRDLPEPPKPDAVFPNNWISFHGDGSVVLYPMATPSRRLERRPEIIEYLQKSHDFKVSRIVDLCSLEQQGVFLEGTGSMVFDHVARVAYACLSGRTHASGLAAFGRAMGYEIVAFDAIDAAGYPVYHTNVMLSLGEEFALVCIESLSNSAQRDYLLTKLKGAGRKIIDVSLSQMAQFAANILQLRTISGDSVIVMSSTAYSALGQQIIRVLADFSQIVTSDLRAIEATGGGSARCMIADIHLQRG